MMNYISQNKHEYNVRRMDELISKLNKKEKELKTVTGFFNTLKLKLEIRKLYKVLETHGSEVLDYEYNLAREDIY
ncbi:MAG TPA: hypothetical protein GX012_03415 [Acholeplasma sp.]|nr:hypothetical protein [Acholeplasma sp.]